VRLGLIPAVISPYVVAAIGPRQARRYFLSAERISATHAVAIGLVHQLAPSANLETEAEAVLSALLDGSPAAQKAAKALVRLCQQETGRDTLRQETIRRIASCRASAEGREGMASFLERRPPSWKAPG
jgi:methylglutaconyl-CoA hydratase